MHNTRNHTMKFSWRNLGADRWPLVCLLLLCAACGTIGGVADSTETEKRVASACAPRIGTGAIQVGVCVLPRLGLFSELGWPSQSQFINSLSQAGTAVDLKARLPDEWDWLTTVEKPAPGYCVDYWGKSDSDRNAVPIPEGCDQASSYAQWRQRKAKRQLETRRVRVSVGGAGVAQDRCNFSVAGLTESYPCNRPVSLKFPLSAENARALTIRVEIDGRQRTLSAVLPRDELFVALGDSYISGEGNPDRQILTPANGDAPTVDSVAWWKDRRCHRSLWAWPSRLALERSATDQWQQAVSAGRGGDVDYRVAVNHGVTLISAACSGAEIHDGVRSRYRGRESLDDLKSVWSSINNDVPFGARIPLLQTDVVELYQARRLRTQVEQVADFTDGRDVDLALLSIGGNDVEFAGLIMKFMFKGERMSTDRDADRKILADTLALAPDYDQLARDIESEKRLAGLQGAVITQYPDPTFIAADKPCDSSLVLWLFEINSVENKFISQSVVRRLNEVVHQAGNRNGWSVVQVNHGQPFSSHGWCADYDGSPYGSSPRWFRKYRDANQVQGPLPGELAPIPSGIMHPTHAAHYKVAKLVEEHVRNGQLRFHFPGIVFDAVTLQPPGEAAPIGKMLEVHTERATSCAPEAKCVAASYQYRINNETWRECKPNECSATAKPSGGDLLKIALEPALKAVGRDAATPFFIRLRGRAANNLRVASAAVSYQADLRGPIISTEPIAWSNAPERNLRLAAIDTGFGVREWRLSGGAKTPLCQEQTVASGPHQTSVCTVTVSSEGTIDAVAIDQVGNETSQQIPTQIDHTPPTLENVWLYGHRHAADEPKLLLWRKGMDLRIGFDVQDTLSGVAGVNLEGGERRGGSRNRYFFKIQPTEIEAAAGVLARQLSMQDGANNQSSRVILHTTIHPLPEKQGVQGTTWWQQQIASGDAAKRLVEAQRIRVGTAGRGSDIGEERLLAGWLNLLDGRIDADKRMQDGATCRDGTSIRAHINIANWRPVTFYSFLREADRMQSADTQAWLACLIGS